MRADSRLVPNHLKEAIDRYVAKRQPVGDFLTAVLSNNLREAHILADEVSLAALPHIVAYCLWEIPANCWGSYQKVEKWLSNRVEVEKVSNAADAL